MPGQIVEQIISRKVNQEIVKHIIKFSNGKDYTLENINKPWFPSIESAREYLISEAEKLIESVIIEGKNKAIENFDTTFLNSESTNAKLTEETSSNISEVFSETEEMNPSEMVVDLGDGKKAKVSLPEGLI